MDSQRYCWGKGRRAALITHPRCPSFLSMLPCHKLISHSTATKPSCSLSLLWKRALWWTLKETGWVPHPHEQSNTVSSGSLPPRANAQIHLFPPRLGRSVVISALGASRWCRIRLLWFKNGIPQFSARSWDSLTPSPCGGLERKEAQKAKITGWDRSKKQRWDKKTSREATDSHAKRSEPLFSLEETPFPLPSAVMGGGTE